MTIDDVAKELNISKTTVSRAISGKGRISESTRSKVLAYIKEHNFKPSLIAKGLAEKRTYNIAVVWPADYDYVDLPFFQSCVMGMSKAAAEQDTDILICMVKGNDIGELDRIVENHKVDGVILTRTLINDAPADYLLSQNFPFVAIGSTEDKRTITVDNDHYEACRELTSILALRKVGRIALLGGNTNHIITRTRYRGYIDGLKNAGIEPDEDIVYFDVDSEPRMARILAELKKKEIGCAICMDDMICELFLTCTRKEGISIPKDMRVASFYDSRVLTNANPSITALHFEDRHLGQRAADMLLRLINGESVENEVLSDYEVILKESTK
ncbi:MAG: LacI family DNA-binding transcriptional regulator [Lachnospiraceae bacterium]|nr:LacI family DNA-binding transcriptional regulator [Lachnospiraceae bacterium]